MLPLQDRVGELVLEVATAGPPILPGLLIVAGDEDAAVGKLQQGAVGSLGNQDAEFRDRHDLPIEARLLVDTHGLVDVDRSGLERAQVTVDEIQLDLPTPFASEQEMEDIGVLYDWQSPADIVKDASSEIDADIGVLKVGMNTERYFYNMYKEALEKIEDPKGKAALEFIMNQENKHYELLQEAHDYLTDKQSWWDEWQKPIFEGG